MIPLYKLEKLPHTQKLRKIAKVFTMAEKRLASCKTERFPLTEELSGRAELFSQSEMAFFIDSAKLLAADTHFPSEAQKAFTHASVVFETFSQTTLTKTTFDETTSQGSSPSPLLLRRAINNIKYLLLTATGRDQADWDFTTGDGSLDPAERQISKGMWVYMEDIRSPFNVGAMFRTAESFGVEKIILSPLCADPNHRRAQRTAMGCIDIVPWERAEFFGTDFLTHEKTPHLPQDLPCPVFALETGGIPIDKFPFPQQGLLIAGSEELGVSPHVLKAADASLGRVSIPSYGAKASLNVSVAFGIALAAWRSAIQ